MFIFQIFFLFVAAIMDFTTAPPNPILDNEKDESVEQNSYKYPDFEKGSIHHPYWHAFPPETRRKLREHDRLELDVLQSLRPLGFKLREAWTVTDKPFMSSH